MVGTTGIEPVKPLSRQESALPTELSARKTLLVYSICRQKSMTTLCHRRRLNDLVKED